MLAEAIVSQDLTTMKRLLNRGVNPNVELVGQNCEPIIFLAFTKSRFKLPCTKIGEDEIESYRLTAKLACLRLLLEYGANPNVRDSRGRTPLEIAILWSLPEAVKLLLLQGADPNLRNCQGQTPLIKAAILGIQDARPMEYKLQIMLDLLDSGAEIDARTPDGKTALMHAVGHSRLEIVKLLVSSGASVTIKDFQGNRARDIISRASTKVQQQYLRRILSQPQIDISRYKYVEYIPEGDRQLARIIQPDNNREQDREQNFNYLPRRFKS